MAGWVWAVIIVAAVVVVATRHLAGAAGIGARRRLQRPLRRPSTTGRSRARRASADAESGARGPRRAARLARDQAARRRARVSATSTEWERVQARFVDDPAGAVREADGLIQSVMSERGYPVDDFDQRAADISVDHPQVVENYREGHRLARGRPRSATARPRTFGGRCSTTAPSSTSCSARQPTRRSAATAPRRPGRVGAPLTSAVAGGAPPAPPPADALRIQSCAFSGLRAVLALI